MEKDSGKFIQNKIQRVYRASAISVFQYRIFVLLAVVYTFKIKLYQMTKYSLVLITALCLGNSLCLFAQSDSLVIPLWKNGAPGYENRKNEPEEAKDYWIKNINNPSVTVFFPPAGLANGTSVLICPGGGFRLLVFKAEGIDPAKFLNKLGITAIILKYDYPVNQIHLIRWISSQPKMLSAPCGWSEVWLKNGRSIQPG